METKKIFTLILVCLSITFYSFNNLNYVFERYSDNTFCFDDSYNSGNKFELTLVDGGKAKIVIKNRNNEIIRTGSGTWSGHNDGFGGNAPVIDLILSTGRLKFTAVVDGSSINMIIDSRNNQWIKCRESESVKTNSSSQRIPPNPSTSKKNNLTTKNLSVSNFKNGDKIIEAKTLSEWLEACNSGKPAWCYYNNDPENGKKYGKLYNWYAVNDPRGLAPQGWHIPTSVEWLEVINFLGGPNVTGKKLKSKEEWFGSSAGTNSSGLNVLPSGFRKNGEFDGIKKNAIFWTSTEHNKTNGKIISFGTLYDDVVLAFFPKSAGLSVRVIKN